MYVVILYDNGIGQVEPAGIPPPRKTALFSCSRKPGVVLRLQAILTLEMALARRTHSLVNVAILLILPRKSIM